MHNVWLVQRQCYLEPVESGNVINQHCYAQYIDR